MYIVYRISDNKAVQICDSESDAWLHCWGTGGTLRYKKFE